ncbi:CAP and S-layer homology domain-containing protein [Ureibacillus terrenus]|uniref:S-layer protein n=1 Tax=Ureibacillus terrenus TaxID=118246 RepID=A0A540V3W9_9BACL|nr:S-layer homology domain-containing protein [Ureibacillus terrenus]TQE91446.1 S-layer protein [Ureibacillus terrenus]
MKRKIIIIAAYIFLLSGIFLNGEAAAAGGSKLPYKDIDSNFWAAEFIVSLTNKGYLSGFPDGTFRPNQPITRGETAGVIAKSLGISLESNFKLKAKDVPTSHKYYKEIRKLAELGVVQNNEYFRPEEPLSRAQVAKMIALAYGVKVDSVNKTVFKDYPKDFWAKDYVESLADVGIIKGTSPTKFSPNQSVTRAQLAALVWRGIEFKGKVKSHQLIYDYLSKHYISTVNTAVNWTNETIRLVNEQRKKAGIPQVKEDPALTQLAIIKAQDMIQWKYFDHYSPYYGYPWDMANVFDYGFTRLGENLGRYFTRPKDAVDAWMASPSHKDNMLKPVYTHIGVGIKADAKGNYYWVLLLSSK